MNLTTLIKHAPNKIIPASILMGGMACLGIGSYAFYIGVKTLSDVAKTKNM